MEQKGSATRNHFNQQSCHSNKPFSTTFHTLKDHQSSAETPLANSLYALVRIGEGADMIPQSIPRVSKLKLNSFHWVHPWCQLMVSRVTCKISASTTQKGKAKMLVTTIDWIQWNTNSTLHSAFFRALKDSTSMPTPSMTPWEKAQQICWNDLSAFANAHHISSVGCHTQQAFCLQWFLNYVVTINAKIIQYNIIWHKMIE